MKTKISLKILPYILAYKSRNFGQNLSNIFSIRLIRGSQINISKMTFYFIFLLFRPFVIDFKAYRKSQFWTKFLNIFFNSTYTRVDLYASIYGTCFRESLVFMAWFTILVYLSQAKKRRIDNYQFNNLQCCSTLVYTSKFKIEHFDRLYVCLP